MVSISSSLENLTLPNSSRCLSKDLVSLLLQAWGAARKVSKDDWLEWLRRLSVVLLKESSSPALRSCWSLAQTYIPLARYTVTDMSTFLATLPPPPVTPLFLFWSVTFSFSQLIKLPKQIPYCHLEIEQL